MKVVALDLDGTIANPSRSSLKERDIISSYLEPQNERQTLISEAERYTLEHPLDFSWSYNGLPAAFVEDSYQWRSAQAMHLWNCMKTNKTLDDFSYKMFLDATKDEEIDLMNGSREFINYLIDGGNQPIIITNSATTKGIRCTQALQLDIPVCGDARKYVVEKRHPFLIDGVESYSERPNYETILTRIMSDYKTEAKDVFVIGDIFTLDLSLPNRLGMNCVLIKNSLEDGFRTPEVFAEHAEENGVHVVSNIREIKL